MSALRPEFHTNLVSSIQDGVLYQQKYLYYYLGRTAPWVDEFTPPPNPTLTKENDTTIRNNILYMGRVNPTDTSLVVPRYDWVQGNVYDQWDHTKVMADAPFYVVTDEFNVYKCLFNNGGSVSSYKPTGTSLFPIVTDDGYVWKYMYTIAPYKRPKFLSTDFIPVQRALTETFMNKGSVEHVTIINGGTGYIDAALTSIDLIGPTTGAGAIVRVATVDRYGEITALEIINPGADYYAGSIATIESEYGQDAELTPINSQDGKLVGFTIANPGFNYKAGDTVHITVGGARLTPVLSAQTGSIVDVIINNPGAGYLDDPTLVVRQAGNAGTGKFGNDTAILKATAYQGSIQHVAIEDPGVNYPVDTATNIVVQGDGTGASFTPIISDGVIIGVLVESPGENYTYIKLRVVGEGTGANLAAVLTGSDVTSAQSVVEQTAIDGAIYAIEVSVPGEGYSYTRANITGDGEGAAAYVRVIDGALADIRVYQQGTGYTNAFVEIIGSSGEGATANATVVDGKVTGITVVEPGTGYSNAEVAIAGDGLGAAAVVMVTTAGTIERVFVTSYGEGYTYADVTFSDFARPEPSELQNAVAYAILPPYGGHGTNAPKELLTDTICIFSALRGDAQLIVANQDYRQYGLIEDPVNLFTRRRLSSQSTLVTTRVSVRDATGLMADDVVICNRKKYRTVKVVGGQVTLMQLSSIYQQPVGSFYVEGMPSVTYDILSVDVVPVVDKYSGNLLYVTNEPPFTTTDTQSVAIRTYLKL